MVTAKESQTYQQFSAWNSSYLDRMALLQQNYTLPCFPPSTTHGQSPSDLRGLNTVQQDAEIPFLKNAQFAMPNGVGLGNKPFVDNSDNSCVPQKRFLIFDQSGNHTRLFVSPSFPPQNEIIASKNLSSPNGSLQDEKFLMNDEKWDENHLSDEEDEMLEDSEEIDALLYSDSDDYDYDSDDDEVTSTRHSPFSIEEEDDKLLENTNEEISSSKRQKLVDGKYGKSSLMNIGESSLKKQAISCTYEDDVGNKNDDLSNKRETKIKLREAMKILESIIPGSNGHDPLSIIDNAIIYLKSMKTEAEDLGFT